MYLYDFNKKSIKICISKWEIISMFRPNFYTGKIVSTNKSILLSIFKAAAEKTGCLKNEKNITVEVVPIKNKSYLLIYKKQNIKEICSVCYQFRNSDTLMDSIVELYEDYHGKSELYTYNKNYFLFLSKPVLKIKNRRNDIQYLKGFLEEYGNLISKNAVYDIGRRIKDF